VPNNCSKIQLSTNIIGLNRYTKRQPRKTTRMLDEDFCSYWQNFLTCNLQWENTATDWAK